MYWRFCKSLKSVVSDMFLNALCVAHILMKELPRRERDFTAAQAF